MTFNPGALEPFAPFFPPVPVPGAGACDLPVTCVTYSMAWQPYVLSCLKALLMDSTWNTSDPAILATTRQQAGNLLSEFMSDPCSVIFRPDPTFPTEIDYSLDGGATWTLILSAPDIPALFPFVELNPAVPGRNTINPANPIVALQINQRSGAALAIFTDGGSESGLKITQSIGSPDPGFPMVTWQSRGAHFLILNTLDHSSAIAINSRRMWCMPGLPLITSPIAEEVGGMYRPTDGTDFRPHYIAVEPDTTIVDRTLEFALTFAGSIVDGDPTIAPTLIPTRTGDTVDYELALNSLLAGPGEAELTFNSEYTALAPGATPTVTIVRTGVDTYEVNDQLPPILQADVFVDETDVDPAFTSLALVESEATVAGVRTVTNTLQRPPDVFDGVFPDTGTVTFRMFIDAVGSMLPMLVPSGFSVRIVNTYGLWMNNADIGPTIRPTNGQHTFGTFPFEGDLKMFKTTGAGTTDGYFALLTDPIDPFAIFTATEDCYLLLLQHFVPGGEGSNEGVGNIYADIELFAPGSEYAWRFDFDFLTAAHTDVWRLLAVNGNDPKGWITGEGYSSGVSGWIVTLGTIPVGDATTFLERVDIYSTTLFPGTSTVGNQLLMPGLGFTVSDPGAAALSTAHSAFDGLHKTLNGGQNVHINSVSYDHATTTNDQLQHITRVTLAGNGTPPTFIPG
jgi:hypothetical protein